MILDLLGIFSPRGIRLLCWSLVLLLVSVSSSRAQWVHQVSAADRLGSREGSSRAGPPQGRGVSCCGRGETSEIAVFPTAERFRSSRGSILFSPRRLRSRRPGGSGDHGDGSDHPHSGFWRTRVAATSLGWSQRRVTTGLTRARAVRSIRAEPGIAANRQPFPSPYDLETNKGDDLNCCGKMPSLRKAGLTGSCSLPEQLGMSPSRTLVPFAHPPRLSTWKTIPPGECRLGRDIHGFLPRYPSFVNLVAVTFSVSGRYRFGSTEYAKWHQALKL